MAAEGGGESGVVGIPEDLEASFSAAGQEHVFSFVRRGLVPAEKVGSLVEQARGLDLGYILETFRSTMSVSAAGEGGALEPVEGVARLSDATADDVERWRAVGLEAVGRGGVGVIILAGGQGTRLGFALPKGLYNVGLPSQKTLFRLQAERVQRVRALAAAKAGVSPLEVHIPVYVMTSPMTDGATRAYWRDEGWFGLEEKDVFFFCQGTLPCFTPSGKLIMKDGATIAEAPDGNGGIYRALHLSGAVKDMEARGVEMVHAFAVDNLVVRAADPVFLGYCLEQGAEVGSKVCPKVSPEEKVGVLCKRGGKFAVVEYSDLGEEDKMRRNESGELTLSLGNLCIHAYSLRFLQSQAAPDKLPKRFHIAAKKIDHADPATGATIPKEEIAKPNGVKLEAFIFDIFPQAASMAVLEIDRAQEFTPVKNAPGSPQDSPDTAREALYALHRKWLADAGAEVSAEGPVEISPLVSYAGEGLDAFAGLSLRAPLHLCLAPEGFGKIGDGEGDGEGAAADREEIKGDGVTLDHVLRDGVHVYLVKG